MRLLPALVLASLLPAGSADAQSPPAPAAHPFPDCGTKAARFTGPKAFELWVTQAGTVSVENPLRPLTPEVTRVLQVVIAGKIGTAYGTELTALRRGGSPGALSAQLGGPIRWEPSLPVLPDPLVIVSETDEPLARLAFQECGEAPAGRALPEAKVPRAKGSKDTASKPVKGAKLRSSLDEGKPEGEATAQPDAPPKPPRKVRATQPRAAEPKTPAGFQLPQGAITE